MNAKQKKALLASLITGFTHFATAAAAYQAGKKDAAPTSNVDGRIKSWTDDSADIALGETVFKGISFKDISLKEATPSLDSYIYTAKIAGTEVLVEGGSTFFVEHKVFQGVEAAQKKNRKEIKELRDTVHAMKRRAAKSEKDVEIVEPSKLRGSLASK